MRHRPFDWWRETICTFFHGKHWVIGDLLFLCNKCGARYQLPSVTDERILEEVERRSTYPA
jgi:hypothetical protein